MNQMKETILLLRQQLEAMRIDKEQSVRRAANAGKSEIAQLQDTLKGLRDTLETVRVNKERDVQAAAAANGNEIAQLKDSVIALRDALEMQKNSSGHTETELARGGGLA